MRSFTRYLPVAKDGSGRVRLRLALPRPARSDPSSPLARRAPGSRILRVRSSQRARWQWRAAWLAADESQGEEAASRRFWLGISPHLARLFITPSPLQLSSILITFSSATTTRISSKSSPDSKTLYTSLSCSSSSSCFASVLLAHCRRSWIF